MGPKITIGLITYKNVTVATALSWHTHTDFCVSISQQLTHLSRCLQGLLFPCRDLVLSAVCQSPEVLKPGSLLMRKRTELGWMAWKATQSHFICHSPDSKAEKDSPRRGTYSVITSKGEVKLGHGARSKVQFKINTWFWKWALLTD